MTAPVDPLVTGLLKDAKLVAGYGRYGVFKDSSLLAAIGDAEKLGDVTASQPAVVNLQKVLNDCSGVVPFSTLAALRSGWSPGDTSRRTAIATYLLVAMSVLMMVITGKMTYVYNRGVSLSAELQDINKDNFSVRFGQTVRQVWTTQKQLRSAASSGLSQSDINLLEDVYYNAEDSLHLLDQRFVTLWANSQSFMTREARFPIWGMQSVYCKVQSLVTAGATGNGQTYDPQQAITSQLCNQGVASAKSEYSGPADGAPEGGNPACAQPGNTAGKEPGGGGAMPAGTAPGLGANSEYEEATRSLQCSGVITLTPSSIYMMTAQIGGLNAVLSPYALWILPALYGSLGAIMFHMRMILNPLLPNPTLARLVHRIVLGALAGMVLAWFLGPDTKLGGQASAIGFSLFTFAFLFGFSLDIFFTILDQFVSMSVTGIKKFGSPTAA
ncbi:MAG: hypothetical protein EOS36_30755 [Mesorhizobium sp.]|uniref:hypothetical protein n=1 Tax=Mesorhizobium sp. TaxID=1871066 RepID=UPI000FE84BE1|nr:hypothetical protein [Mesorhizobium sp.]RWD50016.1 MAG: hypothetical protein EOS36_30755 [Mesorhizobium sp.]RWE37487.1 MAG: hypothetical protein EOS79_24670 [Mesorhizobium sp.]